MPTNNAKLKKRNWLTLGILVGIAIIFFLLTISRLQQNAELRQLKQQQLQEQTS